MSKEHRMKVLEMLQEGKITVDEAERLLTKLPDETAAPAEAPGGERRIEKNVEIRLRKDDGQEPGDGPFPRYLRVEVDGADGEKVNVRVPMALLRTGVKLAAILPSNAWDKMEKHGVDFSQFAELESEELIKALSELVVDVDGADGERVRVFTE